MTRRARIALPLLLLGLAPLSPRMEARAADPEPGLRQAVDSLAAAAMEGWSRVPGIAVAVVDSGGLVLLEGYGVSDVETGEPVDPRRTVR